MKSDTERKKYYTEKLHKKKSRLHVHLSKDLRGKLKTKKRAVLVHKEDRVKIMRGPGTGKEARVVRVSTLNRKVYVEGIVAKNRKGKENILALEPSNLLLIALEPTEERKQIFKDEAFKKHEKPAPAEAKKEPAAAEHKREGAAHEHVHEGAVHTHEHKPATESKPPAHTAVKPATR
jgi:ribosomal protein uL24